MVSHFTWFLIKPVLGMSESRINAQKQELAKAWHIPSCLVVNTSVLSFSVSFPLTERRLRYVKMTVFQQSLKITNKRKKNTLHKNE